MKLEAMNGNLVSLTVKVPPSSELEVTVGSTEEADDGTSPQPSHSDQVQRENKTKGEKCGEDGEKEVVGIAGKKKGTRKKRSTNWEEGERCLLVELIKPKVDYVENRNVDAKSIKAKRLAWMHITKQFNIHNICHRSLEQIQVQWRSMKNTAKRDYQQKNPNASPLEASAMLDFMEQMQREATAARVHVRSNGILIKKEMLSVDDEDMPLAALPVSTNASEDTVQASTIALPSPPQSAESHPENVDKQQPPTNGPIPKPPRKKSTQKKKLETNATNADDNVNGEVNVSMKKVKRVKNIKREIITADDASDSEAQTSRALLNADDIVYKILPTDEKYKKQIFDLIKRSHLAEIEHARVEHEQRLSFETMHQELKLSYFRKNEELKLCQMREEHHARMRQNELEHKARMRAYMLSSRATPPRKCTKSKACSEMSEEKADENSNSNCSKPTSDD